MREALTEAVDDGGPRRGAGDDRPAVECRLNARLLRARRFEVLKARADVFPRRDYFDVDNWLQNSRHLSRKLRGIRPVVQGLQRCHLCASMAWRARLSRGGDVSRQFDFALVVALPSFHRTL